MYSTFLVFLLTIFCFSSFSMREIRQQQQVPTYFHLLPADLVPEVEVRRIRANILAFGDREKAIAYLVKVLNENPNLASNDTLVYALVNALMIKYPFSIATEFGKFKAFAEQLAMPGAQQWF